MRSEQTSQVLDSFLEELLSTKEGTEIYLKCLLAAIKETCTPHKCKQIANKHFELIQEAIQEEE